jgi:starvation-inducible outer membrane lipoprotein
MHSTLRLLTLPTLCLALSAAAQTPAAVPDAPAPLPLTPRVERITHEDGLSRIDELRVGGQTRSIAVQPKNGAPGYEITPVPGGADLTDAQNKGSTGKSRWRILNF